MPKVRPKQAKVKATIALAAISSPAFACNVKNREASPLTATVKRSRFTLLALRALAGTFLALPATAMAAEPSTKELLQEIRRLSQRLEQVEAQKATAEARPGGNESQLQQRVERLEEENKKLEKSLSAQNISEDEPSLASRLKAVESQSLGYKKTARTVESLDGIQVGAGMTMVGQNMASGDTNKQGELNYRADVTVTLPGGEIGNTKGSIFTHVRMGQGPGIQAPGKAFSSVNATSFERPGADTSDSAIVLAEAFYQLDAPLPFGGNPNQSKSHLEVNFGKMDPFVFFDQNKVSDDETRSFMNQSLVHNPLLDTGGDVGVDGLGFSPGVQVAYIDQTNKPEKNAVSFGMFETGNGASFQDSMDFPFWIGQVETTRRFFGGLEGNYRLYGWRNGRAQNYDGAEAAHAGIGISIDQKVAEYVSLFGRYGYELDGKVRFDQALTVGTEISGNYWGRGADALGIGFGLLKVSDDFKRDSLTLDADGDGTADLGYTAEGMEQVAEIFYRYRLMPKLELSPNAQYIRQPGGNASSNDAYAVGLRAQVTY